MHTTYNILALIPARKGSKGLPGKNIRILGGKALIAYTIETALEANRLSTVMVSTDCPDIQRVALQYPNIHAPFLRPDSLSSDHAPSIAVARHALQYYEDAGLHFDALCLLQPTVPFRSLNVIDRAIEKFVAMDADCLITVEKVPDKFNPYWTYQSLNELLTPFTIHTDYVRRQDLPPLFCRNGSVYLSKTELIKSGAIVGGKTAYLIDEHERHVNIDAIADWEKAERIATALTYA